MQIRKFSAYARPTESETPGVRPRHLVFIKPGDSDAQLKLNQCPTVSLLVPGEVTEYAPEQ